MMRRRCVACGLLNEFLLHECLLPGTLAAAGAMTSPNTIAYVAADAVFALLAPSNWVPHA